jgi:hypothetical protein
MQDYKKPFYHFSIDDVIDSLIEVSDSSGDFFSHHFFKFLNIIHNKYNVNIDLYCFYQKSIGNKLRTLHDVSDKYKEIFINNPWLHLGPHALNYESAPYAQTPDQQMQTFDSIYREIERFTGNPSKCDFLRLHFFSESYELSNYFQTKKVHSLFTTDKPAITHRLNDIVKSDLDFHGYAKFNEIRFIRSHFRVETLIDKNFSNREISNLLKYHLLTHGFVTFLTHECELVSPEIQKVTEFILSYFKEHKIMSI